MTEVYLKTANGWELQEASKKTNSGWDPISEKGFLITVDWSSTVNEYGETGTGTIWEGNPADGADKAVEILKITGEHTVDTCIAASNWLCEKYSYNSIVGKYEKVDVPIPGTSWSDTFYHLLGPVTITMSGVAPCLAKGTLITLADKTQKPIEDITYDDELLVWNFDEGHFDSAKPAVILGDRINPSYNILTFEDGTILKTIIDHRIYSCDVNKFVSGMASQKELPIVSTFTQDEKILKLIKREVVYRPTKYYNLITNYHLNVFANGILTSCRLNNLYPIKDMKFIKDNRKIKPASEFNLPEWAYYAFRVGEYNIPINSEGIDHNDNSVEDYVNRCLREAKKGGNI